MNKTRAILNELCTSFKLMFWFNFAILHNGKACFGFILRSHGGMQGGKNYSGIQGITVGLNDVLTFSNQPPPAQQPAITYAGVRSLKNRPK